MIRLIHANPGRLFVLTVLGAVLILPLQAQRKTNTGSAKQAIISFVEVPSRLGISLPAINPKGRASLRDPISAGGYSLEYARRNMVPEMGGSVAVGDFDQDGNSDLYVVVPGGANHLLRNRGNDTFEDVTDKAKVFGSGSDLSATFADYDHSGRPSLFVVGLGGVILYRNNGDGTFSEFTEKAGLKGTAGELATCALLFDADDDGFPDLLLTVYTDFTAAPKKASFTFPNDFVGRNSHLYRNQHDGTFSEVTASSGLTSNPGRTRKALAVDFDGHGGTDILFLRDDKPPALYRNQGHGKFEDKTWDSGNDIWKYAYLDGQTGDFNHEGANGVALWSTIGNEVLISKGSGKLVPENSLPRVYAANRPFGFHGTVADLDGDGYDDLLMMDNKSELHVILNHRGRFEAAPSTIAPSAKMARPKGETHPLKDVASVTPVHFKKSGKLYLFALGFDGEVKVFEEQSSGATHKKSHAAAVK